MAERKVEIIGREAAYKGYLRIDRYRLRHERFAGGMTEPMSRELMERGHAAAVLPYDPEADAVVLIEQFRIGAHAAGRPAWVVETVAGVIDDGETPEDVARRETTEETGCTLTRIEPVFPVLPSPGGCSETVHIFVGQVDSRGVGGLHGLADESEDIRVFVLPFDEALEWVDRGRVENGVSVIALLWLARHREALRRRWRGEA